MSPSQKRVVVLGGGHASPSSVPYQTAQELGRMLAQHGLVVVTGGYGGTMEAASKGAHEAGGHVIGITTREWNTAVNPYVAEEIVKPTLLARVEELVRSTDAGVVMPGGLGTLVELSIALELMVKGVLAPRPIVFVSDHWRSVFDQIVERPYAAPESVQTVLRQTVAFVADAEAATALLVERLGVGKAREVLDS